MSAASVVAKCSLSLSLNLENILGSSLTRRGIRTRHRQRSKGRMRDVGVDLLDFICRTGETGL